MIVRVGGFSGSGGDGDGEYAVHGQKHKLQTKEARHK